MKAHTAIPVFVALMDGEQGEPHGFMAPGIAPANEKGDSPSCTETFWKTKVHVALARRRKS